MPSLMRALGRRDELAADGAADGALLAFRPGDGLSGADFDPPAPGTREGVAFLTRSDRAPAENAPAGFFVCADAFGGYERPQDCDDGCPSVE